MVVSQSFPVAEPNDITRLLQQWKEGRPEALEQLIPLIYIASR
jgi:hypothetical protein